MDAVRIDPGVEMAIRLRQTSEAHDGTIAQHLDRVSRYATELGRFLGLSTAQLMELHYAAPLHDLGKIGIPVQLLSKADRLSVAEMELVRAHTVIGYRILEGSTWPVIQCAARIALSHHECWDGTGYPHGLKAEEIPFVARIVAVVDVYDALISPRAYKPAWKRDEVLREMRQQRGIKFDPRIHDVFVAHLDDLDLPAELMDLDRTHA